MTLLQTSLIDKVLCTTRMADCNAKPMPAATHPLGFDVSGAHTKESWSDALVIGMLMYLASNSHPDIQYAIQQCARFTHNPLSVMNGPFSMYAIIYLVLGIKVLSISP